jgi:hypothetical protein
MNATNARRDAFSQEETSNKEISAVASEKALPMR